MRHWERVLPGRVFHVQYESLVASPNATVAGLLAHCGLEWEDQVLEFYKSQRVVHTFSARQVCVERGFASSLPAVLTLLPPRHRSALESTLTRFGRRPSTSNG